MRGWRPRVAGVACHRSTVLAIIVYAGCGGSLDEDVREGIVQAPLGSPPPAPSQLTAQIFSSTDIFLSWQTGSLDPVQFRVERANGEAGPFTDISRGNNGPTINEGAGEFDDFFSAPLTSGTTFYYRVVDFNADGSSGPSNVARVMYPFAPAAPAGPRVARAFAEELDLSWTAVPSSASRLVLERSSLSATSGFTPIATLATSVIAYPDRNLNPATTYYYRLKGVNIAGDSAYSSTLTARTVAAVSVPDRPATWLVVITHRGVPLPSGAVSFFCDGTAPTSLRVGLLDWLKAEANKVGARGPVASMSCGTAQVQIPASLQSGPTIWSEGQQLQLPLDQQQVMTYLSSNTAVPSAIRTAVAAASHVTVVHYLPAEAQFVQNAEGTKFQFVYLYPWPGVSASAATTFYPTLSIDEYGRTMAHELMHNLGATDKYPEDPSQACATDSRTGLEHDGYDIMCHRIPPAMTTGGFEFPPFTNLVVAGATAREVGWFGDLNADLQVNTVDLQLEVNVLLGREQDPAVVLRADLNRDTAANTVDLQSLVNLLLGR